MVYSGQLNRAVAAIYDLLIGDILNLPSRYVSQRGSLGDADLAPAVQLIVTLGYRPCCFSYMDGVPRGSSSSRLNLHTQPTLLSITELCPRCRPGGRQDLYGSHLERLDVYVVRRGLYCNQRRSRYNTAFRGRIVVRGTPSRSSPPFRCRSTHPDLPACRTLYVAPSSLLEAFQAR